MRVLWDFRLFSSGYALRGIGAFTRALTTAIMAEHPHLDLLIWGNRADAWSDAHAWPAQWIPFSGPGWKRDIARIPLLARQHHIDVLHHWVALGPLVRFGMGGVRVCPTVATVYDMGVEKWREAPFLRAVQQSLYWRVQKRIARSLDGALCISQATQRDLIEVVPLLDGKTQVVYAPPPPVMAAGHRHPYLVTLGGAPTKNLRAVIAAASILARTRPDARIVVCGEVGDDEGTPRPLPASVTMESMESYPHHLRESSGLVFCSLHEGLGVPPLEAMACGCPLLLSDIPVLHETCEGAGIFVDPTDPAAIAEGMAHLLDDTQRAVRTSANGYSRYRDMTASAGADVLALYKRVARRSGGTP